MHKLNNRALRQISMKSERPWTGLTAQYLKDKKGKILAFMKKLNFLDYSTVSFYVSRFDKRGSSYRGKIIQKSTWREMKITSS